MLIDRLAENGIPRLRRYQAMRSEQVICPKCSGGSNKRPTLTVTIDDDGEGAVWLCHKGGCGFKGNVRSGEDTQQRPARTAPQQRPHRVPPPVAPSNQPDWLYDFFAERRIGAKTVDDFGVYVTERRFPPPIGTSPSIVFPYVFNGEVVNRKYRPHPAKNPMLQEKDALPTLFNADALKDAETIIFVEGEPDVLAMAECGFRNTVSVKDGAPAVATFRDDDKRFEALNTHSEQLDRVIKFVLAVDADNPGKALQEELARRLGRYRIWIVQWPDGCKDACDVLRQFGPKAVQDAIATAEKYPVSGLFDVKPTTLVDLRARPRPPVLTTGSEATDEILALPGEGRLIIVTGVPQHGKTSWTRFVAVHTAGEHNRKWRVFSPEHQPWEHFVAQLAQVYIGKPFYGASAMTDDEVLKAGVWLSGRIGMMVNDGEREPPTIDWILDLAAISVLRDGTTDLLIDPWNEVEHHYGDMSETAYIGRALQRFKAFCLTYGCNVWIVAHPAKPFASGSTNVVPPTGYSIAGSANFANKADLGITLWTDKDNEAQLIVWKARERRWAPKGTRHPTVPGGMASAGLDFDPYTGRYSDKIGRGIGPIRPPPAYRGIQRDD